MGEGGVDFQSLARDALLRIGIDVLQRAHIVQAIDELDEDDPNIVDHGEQHLAIGLGLACFAALEGEAVDFGDAVNQSGNRLSELLAHLVKSGGGIFQDVVQQTGCDGGVVHAQLGEQTGDLDAVLQERMAGFAQLAFVVATGEVIGSGDQLEVRLIVAGGDFYEQHLELKMISGLFQNGIQVVGEGRRGGNHCPIGCFLIVRRKRGRNRTGGWSGARRRVGHHRIASGDRENE